jgi:hypothetical protein
MTLIIAAVLIIGGLVGTAVLVVSIPMLFGMMAADVIQSEKISPKVKHADAEGRIAVERGFARGFVIAGGVFWAVAIFAGIYVFREHGITSAILGAFIPLVLTAATLAIGWYYERVAALLLVAASVAVVAWGVIFQFEVGVWMILTFALIGPMLTAASLFWLARRDQEALELAISRQLELVPATIDSQSTH